MTKRLLIFSLAMSLMLTAPTLVKAAEAEYVSSEQTIEEDITFVVNGQSVTITGRRDGHWKWCRLLDAAS